MVEKKVRLQAEDDFYTFVKQAWPHIEGGKKFVGGKAVEAMCEHLEEVFYGRILRLNINIPPRCTKPVASDGIVFCKEKGVCSLDKIEVGDHVLTHTGSYKKVLGVFLQGTLNTLKISTSRGRIAYAEASHPFLTPNGWIEASNLMVGDTLGVVMKCQDSGNSISDEEARLLGYLIGDGCLSSVTTPNITVNDEIEECDIKYCIKYVGFNYSHGLYKIAKSDNRNYGRINILLPDSERKGSGKAKKNCINSVRRWLINHEINGGNSYNKMVPPSILSGNKRTICNFLAAYWACDGYVSPRGKDRKDLQIGCDSVNKKFLVQIQLLLQKLGINSHLRMKILNIKTKKQGDKYTSYALSITTADDCSRFCEQIKMRHAKQKRVDDFYNVRFDFDRILHGEQVVSIGDGGFRDCRCIEVEDDHSFVYNGIAVKNSNCVSVLFPVWAWLKKPGLQFLTTSYLDRLAIRDNVKSRRLIKSAWFQSRWGNRFELTEDQSTKDRVDNTKGGYRVTAGLDSGITGDGGDLIICDDANNVKDQSDVALENALDVWQNVLPTRFNDFKTGRLINVQQRTSEKDISGYIRAHQKDEFVNLILPMEFESESVCITVPTKSTNGKKWQDWRKEDGELLVPDRIGSRELKSLKKALGSEYAISGQLQQRPAPAAGGMIKRAWWMPWKHESPPNIRFVIQAWDTATSMKDKAAYSACLTFGIFKDDHDHDSLILLSAWRKKLEFPELYKAVQRMAKDYRATTEDRLINEKYKPDLILVEEKSSGVQLIQTFNKTGIMLTGWRPDKYGDKEERVRRVTHILEAGRVYVPYKGPDFMKPMTYADFLISQCALFPKGDSRDFVDCLTMILQRVINSGWVLHPLEEQSAQQDEWNRNYIGQQEQGFY